MGPDLDDMVRCVQCFRICLAGSLLAVAVGCGPADSRSADSAVMRFEELNFQFGLPGRLWAILGPEAFNTDATLAMRRDQPEVYFMIMAEDAGAGLEVDAAHLAEIVRRNLAAAVGESSVVREYPRRINGLNGIQFATDVKIRGHTLVYQHWVCSRKGYYYQLFTFGDAAHRAAIGREAERLFTRFSLIDEQQ